MAIGGRAAVLDGVRRIFEGGTASASGADAMLRRFAETGDEAAFATIVSRHGPMVLAVCRRALRDGHDVEDAFQATFLVLVRKAGSIRDGERLGPWLHGVARRVANRARTNAARRRATERDGLAIEPAGSADDPSRAEAVALVDEEIGRLPDRYRRAIVLCDLEGCTQPEAAARLGWSEGSVRGRLARGRALLRSRLIRRGVAAPAVMVGLTAADVAAAARRGEALAKALARAGAGNATAGGAGLSATAVALAREILGATMGSKLIAVGLTAFVAGAALTGAGVATTLLYKDKARGARPTEVAVAQPPPAAPTAVDVPPDSPTADVARQEEQPPQIPLPMSDGPDAGPHLPEGSPPGVPALIPGKDFKNPPEPEPADARRIAVGDMILIEVLEALPGRALSGERLVRPDGTVSLAWYGDLKVAGLTRREVKVKVVEHLRQYITDQALGLITYDAHENQYFWVHPARSNRVFVDDSPSFDGRHRPDGSLRGTFSADPNDALSLGKTSAPARTPADERVDALERKLDRALKDLDALQKERAR